MRFKRATEELEAWVFPALKSAVMRCPLSPSKTSKRMVDVLAVVAVVVGAFLLSVGGVVGRVEVQEHLLWERRPSLSL